MDAIVSAYYWVKLALLIVIALLAVWAAVRGTGPRVFVAWRAAAQVVLATAAFVLVFWLADAGSSLLWVVVLMALGAVAGYFAARRERAWTRDGHLCVRRSALAPWVWAVAVILVAMTLLFGSTYLFALALLVMALALGLLLGQAGAESGAAKRAVRAGPEAVATT